MTHNEMKELARNYTDEQLVETSERFCNKESLEKMLILIEVMQERGLTVK